jgi:hypothetical protein
MMIWLASYPRSGNSFARIVLKHLFHLQTRTVYPSSDTEEVRKMCDLVGEAPPDATLEELARTRETCFVKTHEMPGDDEHPAICVVRDGRDALVSYAHFVLYTEHGIPTGSDREAFLRVLRELILSDEHFGGWGRNVLAWNQRAAPTVMVRFEDLLDSPAEVLQGALADVGYRQVTTHDESLPSFEDLHAALPWFFRQGRVGAWRYEMPEALHELFWERHHEAMNVSGGGERFRSSSSTHRRIEPLASGWHTRKYAACAGRMGFGSGMDVGYR